jgi:hypothetical protein
VNPSSNLGPAYHSVCGDEVGSKKIDHPFSVVRRHKTFIPLNGDKMTDYGSWTSTSRFTNYPGTIFAWTGRTQVLPGINPGALRNLVLARTNPSRPDADLSVAVAELRDLPQLLKQAGDTLLKFGAGTFLAWEFGWKPLVKDLEALLNFQRLTDRRIREIRSLHDHGGLRRRVQLQSTVLAPYREERGIDSQSGAYIGAMCETISSQRIWGTSRWLPSKAGLPPPSDFEIGQQAARAVYGLTIDAATAWNLIPWSWLIDWFTGAGTMLTTQRNTVGATVSSACVMVHNRHVTKITRTSGPLWISGGGGQIVNETKNRYVGLAPSITAAFPLITGRQVAILGALNVMRVPRNRLRG